MLKRRGKRSISVQLITWVLLIIAALVCVIVFVASNLFTHSHEQQIKTDVRRTNATIQQSIYWYVNSIYGLALEIAENRDVVSMDGEAQRPILLRAIERNPHIELLYIQGIDGMQTARSDEVAPGQRGHREWFLQMLETREPFVYKSYYSIKTKLPCASVFVPIKSGGEMVGIFGADISLAYLQDIVEMVSDNEAGRHSLILDGDGVVIAHPNREYILNRTDMRKQARFIPLKDQFGNTVVDSGGGVVEIATEYRIGDEYEKIINDLANGRGGDTIITDRGHTYYISYNHINLPGRSDNWAVITFQERASVLNEIAEISFNVALVAFIAAVVVMVIIVTIIRRRVVKPIKIIIAAAEKIAGGKLDTVIKPEICNSEISAIAEALISMVEQLRLHIAKQNEVQIITLAKLQFEIFVNEALNVQQAFKMALCVLRKHYNPMKVVMVYAAQKNPQYSLSYNKDGSGGIVEDKTYPHNDEVMALIDGKKLLFMNAYAIKGQGVKFVGAAAQLVCVIPFLNKDALYGYLIIESADRGGVSLVKDEKLLLQFAASITEWLMAHEGETVVVNENAGEKKTVAPPVAKKSDDPLSVLRETTDLDIDYALENMDGLEELYIKSIRLFMQLLPENVKKMETHLQDGDFKSFAIEVHGMKGALNNIGSSLGRTAERIEKAAKANEEAYCKENYPPFQEQLLEFYAKITDAFGEADVEKPQGDIQMLREQIELVKTAASGFDALSAKDKMQKITEFSFGADIDSLIGEVASALNRFDCECAVSHIDKLKGAIS